jgi:hypothetical protein
MMKPRTSLFADHERETRRTSIGDPLVGLTTHVDFEALAANIDAAALWPSRAKGGRPPYSTLLMVKILVLQQLYKSANDALEYQCSTAAAFYSFSHKRAQKDVDARWTEKHGKNHFGYKMHASVDKRCKVIRKLAVTHAAVSDSTVFKLLLDPNNTSRDVYADRGYPSAEREANLRKRSRPGLAKRALARRSWSS